MIDSHFVSLLENISKKYTSLDREGDPIATLLAVSNDIDQLSEISDTHYCNLVNSGIKTSWENENKTITWNQESDMLWCLTVDNYQVRLHVANDMLVETLYSEVVGETSKKTVDFLVSNIATVSTWVDLAVLEHVTYSLNAIRGRCIGTVISDKATQEQVDENIESMFELQQFIEICQLLKTQPNMHPSVLDIITQSYLFSGELPTKKLLALTVAAGVLHV